MLPEHLEQLVQQGFDLPAQACDFAHAIELAQRGAQSAQAHAQLVDVGIAAGPGRELACVAQRLVAPGAQHGRRKAGRGARLQARLAGTYRRRLRPPLREAGAGRRLGQRVEPRAMLLAPEAGEFDQRRAAALLQLEFDLQDRLAPFLRAQVAAVQRDLHRAVADADHPRDARDVGLQDAFERRRGLAQRLASRATPRRPPAAARLSHRCHGCHRHCHIPVIIPPSPCVTPM